MVRGGGNLDDGWFLSHRTSVDGLFFLRPLKQDFGWIATAATF
jgi:hypothetical protein